MKDGIIWEIEEATQSYSQYGKITIDLSFHLILPLIGSFRLLILSLLGPSRLLTLFQLLFLYHLITVDTLTIVLVLLIHLTHLIILTELSEEFIVVERLEVVGDKGQPPHNKIDVGLFELELLEETLKVILAYCTLTISTLLESLL